MSQPSQSPTKHSAGAAGVTAQNAGSKFFDGLRHEALKIEDGMKGAENEVLRKEEEAYLMHRHDAEISHLKKLQQDEVSQLKAQFQRYIAARDARKKAKKLNRQTIRDMKRRDAIIMEQETASKEAARVKSTLTAKRTQFDALLSHLDNKHDKQRRQLYAAQDRRIQYEKMLDGIQYANERDEIRRTMQKKFQAKLTHQKALDKRISDQLREVQQMELKHAKETFDLEFQSHEDIHNLKALHVKGVSELMASQILELQAEKERLLAHREQTKLTTLEARHVIEMKKFGKTHRDQLRALKQQQELRLRGIRAADNLPTALGSRSSGGATSSDKFQSRTSGFDDDDLMSDTASMHGDRRSGGGRRAMSSVSGVTDEEEDENGDEENQQNSSAEVIRKLASKHKDAISSLKEMHRAELTKLENLIASRTRELEENQQAEMRELLDGHHKDIEFVKSIQAKEVQMEESVHEAEAKMLIERRVLNSVLATVVDGIVNINPKGTITRFNSAAEKMFQYTSDEVIGKNVKMLQTEEIARNHDSFLTNYLTTGIAKIIGSGRRAFGLKKDGTTFPVHISVSEVLEEGAHLFTGIVRDLTEEVRLEEEQREKDEQKQRELEVLLKELDVAKQKADDILGQMLPPAIQSQLIAGKSIVPESFDKCTILYSDICGFTEISSKSTPMQMVELLNSLYTMFDEIISQYDAYKVETIGDSYMVASGVPVRNGDMHACQIADMSLHLLSAVHSFVVPNRPELQLRMRIGMHSGPVVAGVVGLKMPRYCLFGETVVDASKMESSGQPMRIQVSETTYRLLQRDGSYELDKKGRRSYWLVGKDGFPFDLPLETKCLSTNPSNTATPAARRLSVPGKEGLGGSHSREPSVMITTVAETLEPQQQID
ncbi:adenylate and guanylate cyclase catalytic domain-containing protein [Polychytrium aggregatum]|uniref:adenylate and guanylate cyclase catalytic domain-containing protein n=1 Tax=Polychytrium aggregatum TaxID=110093 RepID=UPI0022FEBD24|nr:adenylate and guanylate cyclase catalytic domain-containing protein [Polychytrium aggregatum]KAI9206776.1 adenylate and guanylate cyclase catalytic domain-containing protein [Polychytrium aggregatum]